MSTLNFPTNPGLNDTYSFGTKTWIWNGAAWQLQTQGAINGIPIGNVTPSTGAFTTLTATGNVDSDGQIIAVGNVSGNFFLGNGSQLSGINSFGTITVSGQGNVVADVTADTLTLVAGNGIVIVTDAGNDIITISTVGEGDSIFATGGSMGTVEEAVTSEEDLGLVTVAVVQEYDLGVLGVDGIVTNQNIVDGSLTGNKFAPDTDLATTGNLSVGNLQVTGTLAFDTVDTNTLVANTANINGTVNAGGSIIPTADITYDLGTDSLRWRDLYLSGNTLVLGDIVIKDSGEGQIGFFQSNGTTPAAIDPTNVDTSQIANGTSRLAVASANGNIVATVGSTTVATISSSGMVAGAMSAVGNVSGANVIATGNVSGANVIATGNVSGANVTATNVIASGNVSSLFNFSQRTITANTTIGNVNASSAGPIIIAEGVTVTVSDGGEWSIV